MIEIKEVVTRKDIKMFSKYPVKLYKGCPYYVPSLRSDEMNTFNPKKNFSLKECDAKGFLCFKDGKMVGRIAGIINRTDNELTGKKFIRFSRLECIDDIEVFKALLGAVVSEGKFLLLSFSLLLARAFLPGAALLLAAASENRAHHAIEVVPKLIKIVFLRAFALGVFSIISPTGILIVLSIAAAARLCIAAIVVIGLILIFIGQPAAAIVVACARSIARTGIAAPLRVIDRHV